jgi:hypothetical protein
MTMQKKECIELIKSFIAERLDGDIRKFYYYDLDQLEKDEKYGAYDPDNSRIANAIYVVLWGNTVPNLTMNNLGGEMYRGDTMNSFNTLMGRPNEDGTSFLGVQKYTHDLKIINLAKMYHEKYHTLGNMMVLPNKTLESARTTLNLLRGGGPWYDYFDLFLSDIKNLMVGINASKIDHRLIELVEINSDFFDYFRGIEGFKDFCKTFYLDKYVDLESLKVRDVFSPHARHWPTRYSEEEYKKYVVAYITKATEIIDYRCGRMIEALEEEIVKYDPTFKVSPKFKEQQSYSQLVNNKFESVTEVKKQPLKERFNRKETSKTEKLKEKIEQFKSNFKKNLLENIALLLAFFPLATIILYSIVLLVRFWVLNEYNHDANILEQNYLDSNNPIMVLLIVIFCLAVSLMSISYVRKHTGIRKIIIILFIVLQIFMYMIPLVFILMSGVITRSEWFNSNFIYNVQIIKLYIQIYGIACIVTLIIPFIMFLFEAQYRQFLKRWLMSLFLFFIVVPLAFSLLTKKFFVYLVVIAGALYIVYMLYLAIRDKCPSCDKLNGLKYVSRTLVREDNISVLVENRIKDKAGNVIRTNEQYVPGVRKVYEYAFRCSHCEYVEKRTVTRDEKCI